MNRAPFCRTDLRHVALIPMSCKPFTAGHDALINLAARECAGSVELFVSLTDREFITGETMRTVWERHIMGHLPSQVHVTYSRVTPVRDIYEILGAADKAERLPPIVFNIYSDVEDVYRNFPDRSLDKYAGRLNKEMRILRRAISRSETIDISGTAMRGFIRSGDTASFIAGLPAWMDGEAVWELLRSDLDRANG